jgi:hypothetical protein
MNCNDQFHALAMKQFDKLVDRHEAILNAMRTSNIDVQEFVLDTDRYGNTTLTYHGNPDFTSSKMRRIKACVGIFVLAVRYPQGALPYAIVAII